MAGSVKTYNPKKVTISLGSHIVSSYADDSFITIDPNGDGITKKVGCDGEILRSVSPDDTYVIKLALLQSSPTNAWLQQHFNADVKSGNGMFPVLIKDLTGSVKFSATKAWVAKAVSRGYGKESSNREWEIHTGSASMTE